jgi:hypothetical protein
MPVRVKKLAAELNVQPQRVLEWLRETGFPQYANETDMVVDVAADKVRKAARKALKVGAAIPRPPVAPSARRADPLDQMLASVGAAPDVPVVAFAAAAAAHAGGLSTRETEVQRAAESVRHEERRVQATLREVEQLRANLVAQTQQLASERAAWEREREHLHQALAEREAALEARALALETAASASGIPITALLERRGLRGIDEMSRAFAALARSRLLDPVLPRLRVTDSEPVSLLLRDRLVLAASAADLDGVAAVQVPADRAEVPGDEELARVRLALSGEFLLSGLRRVRVVGGPAALVRSLRTGLDPRLDVQFVAARARDEADARRDVAESDIVVLWQIHLDSNVLETYRAGRAVVVVVADETLKGLAAEVHRALSGEG